MPKRLLLPFLLILTLVLSACDEGVGIEEVIIPDTYEVDPAFREFYEALGGQAVLGPAISQIFMFGEVKYQYTVASLMVHDPQAPTTQRKELAALGLDMNVAEPAVPPPANPEDRYVDGHIIPAIFVPMYEKMNGARYMGRPLSEMHYNPDKQRYEQYFENLGLYWVVGDPTDAVGLLAYGAWKCDSSCRQPPSGNSSLSLPFQTAKPFVDAVARLGPDLTGFAISEAYETPDGYVEQVFENVVLVSDPNKPGRIFLRAITERLGWLPEPLVEPNGLPNFTFYPLREGRGYNIPQHFLDYLAMHGGMEVAGAPIMELRSVNDRVNQQCFKNMCLEEQHSSSGQVVIRPGQLGYLYNKLAVVPVQTPDPRQQNPYPEGLQISTPVAQSEQPVLPGASPEQPEPAAPQVSELSLQVWEAFPMLANGQAQEIGVVVFENNVPLANIEPDLIVSYPDGNTKVYYMLPTGSDGQTRSKIDPINALNGSTIQYQVCVYNLPSRSKYCVRDSYIIWDTP